MSIGQKITDALVRAAESILDQQLTSEQINRLVGLYNNATGTHSQKSHKALREFTGLTDIQYQVKAASDNTNRIMRDLENVLENYNPPKK